MMIHNNSVSSAMQYDVKTPEEYLEVIEADWRKDKLLTVREMIKAADPALVEGISYKMLSYADDKGDVFCLNAQSGYVSLYIGDTKKVDPSGELLKGFNLGKGCIRIKKTIDLESTGLNEFIQKAVAIRQAGGDVDC